mmetsp:Transcript_64512/g.170811  ORF Transcript_64512/g.170811 Transcript_64512/m.170811 type:complete len:83 (-) Transcript_64512:195-443(-)
MSCCAASGWCWFASPASPCCGAQLQQRLDRKSLIEAQVSFCTACDEFEEWASSRSIYWQIVGEGTCAKCVWVSLCVFTLRIP